MSSNPLADLRAVVDKALQPWRQGDCVLGEQYFAYRSAPKLRLVLIEGDQGEINDDGDDDLIEDEVRGLIVVTQTCDIVRSCADRRFIEVSPLVEVDETWLAEIEAGRRPAFAVVPTLKHMRLVADLDRTMTIEKSIVLKWERTAGWSTDQEIRQLAASLARKRSRFAFPDDFVKTVEKFQERVKGKHSKQTDEGTAFRGLSEIRVAAEPSWDAPQVTLTVLLIKNEEATNLTDQQWSAAYKSWSALLVPIGRYGDVSCRLTSLQDLTALEYVQSERLDLDHLTVSSVVCEVGAPGMAAMRAMTAHIAQRE